MIQVLVIVDAANGRGRLALSQERRIACHIGRCQSVPPASPECSEPFRSVTDAYKRYRIMHPRL